MSAADTADLEKRFAEANAKIDAGDAAGALELYNEILEANPDADNVWITRAIAKWKLNDRSGARADLALAIKLNPDNFQIYATRARFRYQEKDYQASLADFDRAIERMEATITSFKKSGNVSEQEEAGLIEARSAELYGMRGEVNSQLGETNDALRDLDRAIQLKPDYASAIFARARLHEGAGDAAAAMEDYTRVVKLAPQFADAWRQRGWLRFYARDWDAAESDATKLLELAPGDAEATRLVGFAKFAKGDYAAAAGMLAKAADADPGPGAAYALFIRHYALLRMGGADKRVAASWESWQDAPWLQALGKFIAGQLSEEELEKVAQDTPDDGELAGRACEMHFYMGLARKQAGDKSTARLRFQSALGTNQKTYIEDALSVAELKRT
jgi:tetratricopeptide (TPR) repeat protein